jgi:hypothetical protein
MRWLFPVTRRDAMRGAAAGTEAVAVRAAAQAMFEAGGHHVLPATVQNAVRSAVENEASRVLAVDAGKRLLEAGASAGALTEGAAVRAVAGQTVQRAGRQLLRGVTAAAGAGALIDGGWALASAVRRMRAGKMTGRQAAVHVVREAGKGAAATAAGTAAAALLVALTGGVAAPAVFVVGGAASLGAKMGLDAWLGHGAAGRTAPTGLDAALQTGEAGRTRAG